jgi:DNA-binding transcriptional ArsR family regulator
VSDEHSADPPNLTALASASMAELVGEIVKSVSRGPAGSPDPDPDQLAEYVLSETVRLIRLGTRPEIADAAVAVSRVLITKVAARLSAEYPQSHAALSSASALLSVASSPASRGGELTVLRSYNGNALSALWHVDRAKRRAIPRARLLGMLRVEESYLSHLLADLEAAGLIERIRDGRVVTVHLGPRGYTPSVQRLLQATPPDEIAGASPPPPNPDVVRAAITRIRQEAQPGADVPVELQPLAKLWQTVARRRDHAMHCELVLIGDPMLDGERVYVRLQIDGGVRSNSIRMASRASHLGVVNLELSQEELLCEARVEGGRIVEARLWQSHDGQRAVFTETLETDPLPVMDPTEGLLQQTVVHWRHPLAGKAESYMLIPSRPRSLVNTVLVPGVRGRSESPMNAAGLIDQYDVEGQAAAPANVAETLS